MNEYKYTKIFSYILIYFQCAHRKIRTFNCTGSKAVAYSNSAIRAINYFSVESKGLEPLRL